MSKNGKAKEPPTEKRSKKDEQARVSAIAEAVSKEMHLPIVDIDRGTYSEQSWTTGVLTFDMIFGGGWPIGGWVTIVGPSGAGKTTIVTTTIAICQRLGVPQFVFDHEASLDPLYGKKIGAVFKKQAGFHYIQIETGQDTYRFVRRVLKQFPTLTSEQVAKLRKPVAVIFIDSLASMLPDAVADNDENTQPARSAAMHSQYIPLVKKMLQNTGCTLIATNQLRLNPLARFGNPEVEPGGNAIQHFPDMRIRVSRHAPPSNKKEQDEGGGAPAPQPGGKRIFKQWTEEVSLHGDGIDQFVWVAVRTLKNKHFAPFQEAEFRINLGKGIDPIWDALEYLKLTGQVVVRRGQRYDILLPDYQKHKLSWDKFARKVTTSEFRARCRQQLIDGSAYKLYFQVKRQNVDVMEKHGLDVLAIDPPTAPPETKHRHKGKPKSKRRDADAA
jgi:RecA/RadA recombinase